MSESHSFKIEGERYERHAACGVLGAIEQDVLDEMAKKMTGDITRRIEDECLRAFITVPIAREAVNLADETERRLASATMLGYMAGLSGRSIIPPFHYRDCAALAWQDGREQGIEHRAKCHERDELEGVFTMRRYEAIQIRMERFNP